MRILSFLALLLLLPALPALAADQPVKKPAHGSEKPVKKADKKAAIKTEEKTAGLKEAETATKTEDEEGEGKPAASLPRFAVLRFATVNLRTGPGTRYPIDWVYKRQGLPVELLTLFDGWYRLRDFEGAEGWVHKSQVKIQRRGIVTGKMRPVQTEPNDKALAVANLMPNVIFDIKSCDGDWCYITGDGFRDGYLRKDGFFGAYAQEKFD